MLPAYRDQITIQRYISTSPIVYGITLDNALQTNMMKKIMNKIQFKN